MTVSAVAICLLTACTSSSTTPKSSPSFTSAALRGAVRVSVVHTCGAGGRRCSPQFLRALDHAINRHSGLPFVTPDTMIFPSQGCAGALRAPFGHAHVGDSSITVRVDWVGAGPDCFGPVIGFLRFAHPVYDMHSKIRLVAAWSNHGRYRHVDRSTVFAAPELSGWVHSDWQPAKCRRCNPTPGPGTG
jgi:hypothetical protein